MNNIAVAQEKFSDDFLENLGETHDLFEMFANAEFTEAFMVCNQFITIGLIYEKRKNNPLLLLGK